MNSIITATKALRVWGLCHQLRLDEDDSAITKSGRRQQRIEALRRDRDFFVQLFTNFTERGELTPDSKKRIKALRERCDAEICRIRSLGLTGPLFGSNDAYARGATSRSPQVSPESGVALIFLTVETYFAARPMQRALAFRIYVNRHSVRSFRYEESDVAVCSSGTAAVRIHRSLKQRLDDLFRHW